MGYSSIYSPIHAYALQRALPLPTKRNGHRRLREAAAQHARRWENDPVQPEMVSLHQGRLSSVDWHWAAQEESAPLRRIMMTLDFEFVH